MKLKTFFLWFQTCKGHRDTIRNHSCSNGGIKLFLASVVASATARVLVTLDQCTWPLVLPRGTPRYRTRWKEKEENRKENEEISAIDNLFLIFNVNKYAQYSRWQWYCPWSITKTQYIWRSSSFPYT